MLEGEPKGKLPLFDIEQSIREFDDESYEARVFGRFKFLSGAVYKKWPDYRPNILIKIKPINVHERYVHRMIIDPHDRRPPAVGWDRIDQFKTRHIIREWPSVQDNCYGHKPFHRIVSAEPWVLRDWVSMWIAIEKELGITNTEDNRIKCLMDPNFGRKPNSVTGKYIYQEYQDEFKRQGSPRIINTTVNDDLYSGHQAVRNILKPTGHGEQKLFIDASCTNIDHALSNYMYEDWSGKAAEDKAPKEGVRDKYKDFADIIRYDIMMPVKFPRALRTQGSNDYHYQEPEKNKSADILERARKIRRIKRPKGL